MHRIQKEKNLSFSFVFIFKYLVYVFCSMCMMHVQCNQREIKLKRSIRKETDWDFVLYRILKYKVYTMYLLKIMKNIWNIRVANAIVVHKIILYILNRVVDWCICKFVEKIIWLRCNGNANRSLFYCFRMHICVVNISEYYICHTIYSFVYAFQLNRMKM